MERFRTAFIYFAATFALFAFAQALNSSGELQIRNKLSLYALAVDNKDFNLFDQIFSQDVFADYVGQTYSDLPSLTAFLSNSVANKVTQHAISSTVVDDLGGNGTKPNSTAYLVATFLGQGNLTGTSLALYGKYLDSWVQENGVWKINRRVLELLVSA